MKGAFWGIFANKGEICCAGSRLLVHEEIYDRFLEQLVSRARQMRLGDPLDRATQMGPQISAQQMDRVLDYIRSGVEEGARLLCGGERDREAGKGAGYFVKPTVFAGRAPGNAHRARGNFRAGALRHEIQGGRGGRAHRQRHAVRTRGRGVDARPALAHRMAAELKAGSVWINTYNAFDSASPFGGVKQSGFGRELGSAAIEQYTSVKSVWVRL